MRSDTGAAALVAVFVALVCLAPEHVARRLGQSVAALDFAAHGAETAALWLGYAVFWARRRWDSLSVVAVWAAYEALLRPACRLALPMDRAPQLLPGQTLCEAAAGTWTTPAGLLLAAVVALYLHLRGTAHGGT